MNDHRDWSDAQAHRRALADLRITKDFSKFEISPRSAPTTKPTPRVQPPRPKSLQRKITYVFVTGILTVFSLSAVTFCSTSVLHTYDRDTNLAGMAPNIIAQDSNSGGGPLLTPAGYPDGYPAYPVTRRFLSYHYPHHWHRRYGYD